MGHQHWRFGLPVARSLVRIVFACDVERGAAEPQFVSWPVAVVELSPMPFLIQLVPCISSIEFAVRCICRNDCNDDVKSASTSMYLCI
jgi:hypothetical protein